MKIITDFNNGLLKRQLSKGSNSFQFSEYSQHINELYSLSSSKGSVGFCWVRLEAISSKFKELLNFRPVALESIIDEIDSFIELIRAASHDNTLYFVRFYKPLGVRNGVHSYTSKICSVIDYANGKLDELTQSSDLLVIEPIDWFMVEGNPVDYKLSYLAKVPYTESVFVQTADTIIGIYNATRGKTKKLVVLDLDNTLWGGVIGDDGIDGIQLDKNHYLGEAFLDFQEYILALKNRGIMLAISSKNTESVAINAIEKHSSMVIRMRDIAAYRINWEDKAQNIADIVKEINIGMDSVVFLDDNPVERDRVSQTLEGITVPELPKDPCLYRQFLESLNLFDAIDVSNEDIKRTESIVSNKQRENTKKIDRDEWLSSLETCLKIDKICGESYERALQLLNKTNQFNLTTRRFSKSDFSLLSQNDANLIYTISLSDKFGDLGITGVVVIDSEQSAVTDFVLSCRIMGRDVEKHIVNYLYSGISKPLNFHYSPTEKNGPILDFLSNNFEKVSDNHFSMNEKISINSTLEINI
ncbi:HAD-IIIC family phosphatase [Vibrio alfacsensis]|uniref:HAD-IIIC family phosphatase n=1 Tax=Vibrio alfacsensis TaxID=1074311 RepID=UPI0040678A2A